MWVGKASISDFQKKSCWKVEFFCNEGTITSNSTFDLVSLREIVAERKETLNPQTTPDELLNYVGLENVQSMTGDLIDFHPKYGKNIRSRSKVFKRGDILYGRLRPYLNKVFLADEFVYEGICSGEFYVLKPDLEKVLPNFLRATLVSQYVQQYVQNLQTGSALPRLQIQDFLEIEIPLPPIEVQQDYEEFLIQRNAYRRKLSIELSELPQKIIDTVVNALENGENLSKVLLEKL
ncbi:restriction endonuclease subunit S [Phormidium sp. LEGE 05292]|uniref:restriction endonuclease subunit S n=1 Tax=[Phormidium] sp. LEGE 05292 TaxID=767427 RepID=UPI0018812EA9|nr:restriction endonuclease subunit S [Phormidium sp. LEGE 05292]MBE9227991.1 restriction endonuclease subunit S [Phormidium sp. LEGE 05292]